METSEQKFRVLIVDDEPVARQTLEALLFREGYELFFASSGIQTIDDMDKFAPDVLLLDVMMPSMNGFEVCRYLKNSQEWRHIPIILLTLNIASPSPQVVLDANLFLRVLDNLLSNAVKVSPKEGRITLTAEYTVPVAQQSEQESHSTGMRLRVIDEGPGILPEDMKRIFDQFEVGGMKDHGKAHVGLGLAFCKMVVEAHGGQIYAENGAERGAILTIEL